MELENKLRNLKLQKALILAEIEQMSVVDDSLFVKIGKVSFEIVKTQKQLLSTVKNDFED